MRRLPTIGFVLTLVSALIVACADEATDPSASGTVPPGDEGTGRSEANGETGSTPPPAGTDASVGLPKDEIRSLGPAKNGRATFYDADGSGNCSFDKSPDDLDVTAMAMPEYAASAACGTCFKVTGPKGEVTVRVVDSCPGCATKNVNLDLSAEAFAKIANPVDGNIAITYEPVSCATSGNVAYHFKDGSSQFWTAIQIRNHRVPIAKVEYLKGTTWVAMNRTTYNYFVASPGVGTGSKTIRVTATDGQVIEDTLADASKESVTVQGTKQFD